MKHTRAAALGLAQVLATATAGPAADRPAAPLLLDVFPPSTFEVPVDRRGETVFSARFTPSGSLWDRRLNESRVFQLEIAHRQDPDNSFTLRVGRGGQIYSLRGPFGESVPPSWRAAGNGLSPWNDEVWQFVAVCTRYNGLDETLKAGALPDETAGRFRRSPFSSSFFIHNSGAYIPGDSAMQSLYCPLLASELDADDRCFRMLNWGLVPQVRTMHRSPILFYTQIRDAGDGVIELTWVVHNFSVREDVVFDHLNAPWGGTRVSSLPLRYVSSPAGDLLERGGILNHAGVAEVGRTGGWNLSCASDADDSPSLALVYGRDRHLEAELRRRDAGEPHCQFKPSLYRDWRAGAPLYETSWKDWASRPANSFRNYDVAEVIPKLRLAPGTSIWYRSFLVVNRRDRAIALARSLVDRVDYGLARFDPETTPVVPAATGGGSGAPAAGQPHRAAGFGLPARPMPGTRPLFVIRDRQSGSRVVTTDPYHFVTREKLDLDLPEDHPHHAYYRDACGYSLDDQRSEWESLLGFGFEQQPAAGRWERLSALLDPTMFPAADRYHLDLWVRPDDNPR